MEDIGSVVAVLNDRLLLIQTTKAYPADTELTVFGRIPTEKVEALSGLSHLDIPKGQIRIVSYQNENLYLARRFRHPGEQRREFVSSPFSGNLLSEILKGKEEIVEIPGPWSAEFDPENSLNIQVDRRIKPGDLIALK